MVSPDGVAPSWMVGVSASVNLPLHHKVQKFSSGTGSPRWSRKKGRKQLWWWWCSMEVHSSEDSVLRKPRTASHRKMSSQILHILHS